MPVDPRLCCAAQICCDNPEKAKKALDELLRHHVMNAATLAASKQEDYDISLAAANWILDNFDLVPKGTATALYKNLRPWFAQAKEDSK